MAMRFLATAEGIMEPPYDDKERPIFAERELKFRPYIERSQKEQNAEYNQDNTFAQTVMCTTCHHHVHRGKN